MHDWVDMVSFQISILMSQYFVMLNNYEMVHDDAIVTRMCIIYQSALFVTTLNHP